MNQFLFLYNVSRLEAEVLPEFPFACYNTYKNAKYSRMFHSKCYFPGPRSFAKLIGRGLKKEKENKQMFLSIHQIVNINKPSVPGLEIWKLLLPWGMSPRRCAMFGQNKMEEC